MYRLLFLLGGLSFYSLIFRNVDFTRFAMQRYFPFLSFPFLSFFIFSLWGVPTMPYKCTNDLLVGFFLGVMQLKNETSGF